MNINLTFLSSKFEINLTFKLTILKYIVISIYFDSSTFKFEVMLLMSFNVINEYNEL